MRPFILPISLSLLLCASLAFAQEKMPPLQAKQDSARQDTTAHIASPQTPPDSAVRRATAQYETAQPAGESGWTNRDYGSAAAIVLSLVSILFAFYQYRRRIALEKEKTAAQEQAKFDFQLQVKEQVQAQLAREAHQRRLAELEAEKQHKEKERQQKIFTAEDAYRESLRDELGSISLLGSPEIRAVPLNLIDCFVNLDISEKWHSEDVQVLGEQREMVERERDYPPNKAIERALKTYRTRLLLIIGDPGSGKTTLLKYFALKCLDGKYGELGFKGPRLPIFLPLRNVDPQKPFAANLAEREKTRPHPLAENEIDIWLTERDTLILLDGLDEVSQIDERIEMCRWIETQCSAFHRAFFVVTSRWTGYRKADGVELEIKHLRADVRDFSPAQQKEFLRKWFNAVYLSEDLPDSEPDDAWREVRLALAKDKATAIIGYLEREENKSLQQLAAIPMLLQIMAIIWKEQEYLPRSRATLYNVAMNYLLEHRDRHRKLDPILSAEHARSVLSPAALWMQEELHTEEVDKDALHARLQPALDEMDEQPKAKEFCENLRDRAGLIADYGANEYIFRHKSFREYLTGMQLAEVFHEPGCLQRLVEVFGDDWWEEPLRFFISKPNGKLFDGFMQALFASPKSRHLSDKQQDVLRLIVQEAGQRKIDALVAYLNDAETGESQRRYILDCLKTIGTGQALRAVQDFARKGRAEAPVVEKAWEIVREHLPRTVPERKQPPDVFRFGQKTFINPLEYNAEYILIPGGTFRYSVTKKTETVPDIYFAKYPVTNRRYHRFIRYLRGEERELDEQVPLEVFGKKMLAFAEEIQDYREYLGKDITAWAGKLTSKYDDDRRFNGDDQPVVAVSWFAARTYCLWLSVFETSRPQGAKGNTAPAPATVYRLPREIEWERAAAGRNEDGPALAGRTYPWPKDKGNPNDKLANYGRNVGATTPVGRYPEGATPEGLLDMAGNVWEWQEDWYDERKKGRRSLRGGSWSDAPVDLACANRDGFIPDGRVNCVGFRVVRPRSKIESL